ncbi:MAG: DNA translocase FtsK [Oxalobacter sp.]|nr:MAG: DNA translocase FtsK [Oxalobacter sp.]
MNRTSTAYTRNTPPPKENPMPDRLRRLLSEAGMFALVALGIYLVLILLTYSQTDPGWSHANAVSRVSNWGGRLGAYLADLLLFIFGFSAWWWCLVLLHRIWRHYRKMAQRLLLRSPPEPKHRFENLIRVAGLVLLMVSSSAIEFLRMYTLKVQLPSPPGGMLGKVAGQWTHKIFGFNGGTLLLLLMLTLGISLFFQISWLQVAEKIGAAIENTLFRIRNWFAARADRKMGQAASIKREGVIVQERARIVEHPPIKIEQAVVAVQKSERAEKERQATLFADLTEGDLPPLMLLDPAPSTQESMSVESLEFTSRLIEKKLTDFGVSAKVVAAYPGPVITRYEIDPDVGVKGSTIVNLGRDLARALALSSVRVVETIPGKNYMGLELPNSKRQVVRLSEILGSKVYSDSASLLTIALGKDIAGNPVVVDLARMPHLLVAGTTGSGKSVAINAIILSLLYKSDPQQVRLLLIDPKMLELSIYEGIPHLLAPVVTDMQQAGHALKWAVEEMDRRYRKMSHLGVRNLSSYNNKIADAHKRGEPIPNPFSLTPDAPEPLEHMPAIVIVIDELADLMMVVGKKVEELIARIAQKARAAGIHLILATQRPSVDVITGLIKANIPTRIAFQVSSKIDSRTILDQMGAESLLGMGDMLYLPPGSGFPMRVHGAFVADDEVHRVVSHLKEQGTPNYVDGILDGDRGESAADGASGGTSETDVLYDRAVACVLETGRASTTLVQRRLGIGYPRAARLMDQLEQNGVISPMRSNGNRDILVPHNKID